MGVRYFTIADAKPIPGLSGIGGPITVPVVLPYNEVLALVRKGYTVYEHNPLNKDEKILLTLDNVHGADFDKARAQKFLKEAKARKEMEDKGLVNKVASHNTELSGKQKDKSLSIKNKNKPKTVIKDDFR